MKLVTLYRYYWGKDCTLGVLKIDGGEHEPIYTLEEPWLHNERKVSCIPMGEYLCRPHDGVQFKDVWQVMHVPNRSAILIHQGNTVKDIEGCILVGLDSGRAGWIKEAPRAVMQSTKAVNLMRNIIGVDSNFRLIITT